MNHCKYNHIREGDIHVGFDCNKNVVNWDLVASKIHVAELKGILDLKAFKEIWDLKAFKDKKVHRDIKDHKGLVVSHNGRQ